MNDRLLRACAAIVLAHGAVAIVHGAAHAGTGVGLAPAAGTFVVLVIGIAPFAALVLLRGPHRRAGALLLLSSMLGALLFGIANHYLLPGADQVTQLPPSLWRPPFQLSAALLVTTEALGAAIGIWATHALQSVNRQS